MDELKKKVEDLTPQNAFYAYFGVAGLVLLLFLVAPFVGLEGETINGFNVLFGKESVTFGTGTLFGYLYVISVIGVLYLAYTKKQVNFLYTLAPFATLFICGFTCSVLGLVTLKLQFLGWIEIILMAALVGFAYLRGTAPVALDQKK